MPTDMNGRKLKRGDRVLVPCVVLSVSGGDDYGNVRLETERPMPPEQYRTRLTLNAKQLARRGAKQKQHAATEQGDVGRPHQG
jgi:hypothetical protein